MKAKPLVQEAHMQVHTPLAFKGLRFLLVLNRRSRREGMSPPRHPDACTMAIPQVNIFPRLDIIIFTNREVSTRLVDLSLTSKRPLFMDDRYRGVYYARCYNRWNEPIFLTSFLLCEREQDCSRLPRSQRMWSATLFGWHSPLWYLEMRLYRAIYHYHLNRFGCFL